MQNGYHADRGREVQSEQKIISAGSEMAKNQI
jgi:hypothetical protein